MKYRPDIDGLRALAVLSVLFFHLDLDLFSGGFVGVDIFFVISGFLITRNIVTDVNRGSWSFKKFYVRRFRRLFPAFFATIAISLLFAALLLSPSELQRFSQSLLYSVVYISNFFFYSESGYFDSAADTKPLLHLWSLAVEEQFYLVWPLLIVLILKFKKQIAVAVSLISIGAVSLVAAEDYLTKDSSLAFFMLPFRIFEFVIGALLVWLVRDAGKLSTAKPSHSNYLDEALLVCGIGMMIYSVTFFDSETPFPGVNALIPCIGAALAIYAGGARYSGILLRNRLFVAIGVISYSIYLVHWPIIVFYKLASLNVLTVASQLTIFILSIALGYLLFKFVESPLRMKTGKIRFLSSYRIAAVFLGLMVAISIPAFHIIDGDGWRWRLPNSTKAAVAPQSDVYRDKPCRKEKKIPGCVLGADKKSTEEILVIGDSHANAMWPGFHKMGLENNLKVRVWMVLGCTPLFDVRTIYEIGGAFQHLQKVCESTVDAWEKYIFEAKPSSVVIVARWATAMESGANYGPGEIPNRMIVPEKPGDAVWSMEAAKSTFRNDLMLTIDRINKSGTKVIVLSQVPLRGVNPSHCVDMPRFLLSVYGSKDRCDVVSYEKMKQRLMFADKTIKKASSESTAALPIILSDIFCDDASEKCLYSFKDVLLYRDADHVSQAGSIFIANAIEENILQFIAK